MEKIAIIGSSGAGKSRLAKKLSSRLGMKKYHLDRLFWKTGWKRIDGETRIDILQNIVQEKQWIIEGAYLNSSDLHLSEADIIIYFDISPLICLWRVFKRHYKLHNYTRRDIPEGCKDRLTVFSMLKVLSFPIKGRKNLMRMLRKYDSKQIIRLRSNRDIEDFLRSARNRYFNQGIDFSLIRSARSNPPILLPN